MTTPPPLEPPAASTPPPPDAADAPTADAAWSFADASTEASAAPTEASKNASTASKPRAGRRPGAVWGFFSAVRTEQNKTHAVCRFCARRCAGVAARMATHVLAKCPAVPAPERDALAAALAREGASPAALQGPPAAKRARLADGHAGGLAAFGGPRGSSSDEAEQSAALVASALQLVAVACLRVRAPLALVEDAFFRDALALLRPHGAAAALATDAAALRASVLGAVTRDAAQWMRASESFTFVGCTRFLARREWRGADSQRRAVLLGEVSAAAWREELETLVQRVGEATVVGLCCAAPDLVTATPPLPARVTLVSRCLLTETVRLWALVVDAVPQLASVAVAAAAEAAQTDAASVALAVPDGPTHSIALQGLGLHAGWSLPFRVVRRVMTAVGHSLPLPEEDAAKSTFWKELRAVDALLAPFATLFALSESKSVGASQIVLGWLWLLATLEQSPLVAVAGEEKKDGEPSKPLAHAVLSAVTRAVEDHHLVALLLDPRFRGAGLSTTGRRKVKSLVVQVATRLWPATYAPPETEADSAAPDAALSASPPVLSPARQALLTQLANYIDKTGCFADDVTWEMTRGAAPETFWRDYAQDAPQLSALALAVLTHVVVTSQTSEFLEETSSQTATEPLDARQIRFHFERNRKRGAFDFATVVAEHAELLAPAASASAASAVSVAPTEQTPLVLPLVEAVGVELMRLRAAGGAADAITVTATEDTPVVARGGLADATWFAFQSESDEQEIVAALRCVLPASMAAVAPAPNAPSPVALEL